MAVCHVKKKNALLNSVREALLKRIFYVYFIYKKKFRAAASAATITSFLRRYSLDLPPVSGDCLAVRIAMRR